MTVVEPSKARKPKATTALFAHQCSTCKDTKYHVDISAEGKLTAKPCTGCSLSGTPEPIATMLARCQTLDALEIDPDSQFIQIEPLLTKRGIKPPLSQAIKVFFNEWPKRKKELKKAEIIANPENFSIVRGIDCHHVTALHLLTRNSVFRILGKHERAERTRIDEFGKEIDVSEDRTFLGWGGQLHLKLSGPVIDTYDEAVFYACIKIWHKNSNATGLTCTTNLTEIWNVLGNQSKMNSKTRDSLRRSLRRLAEVRLTAQSMENHSFWVGGIISEVIHQDHENPRYCRLIITFNKNMVPLYLAGAYATLNLPLLNKMQSAYSKRTYEFLMSHKETSRSMGLEKWREVLGVSDCVPMKTLKQRMKESLLELKLLGTLTNESRIDMNNIVHTSMSDVNAKSVS